MSIRQVQENLDLPKGTGQRGSRGRKDKDGGEEPLRLKPDLKKQCRNLMVLLLKKNSATDDYNKAAKAVAESCNGNTANIKRLVQSSAKGKFKDAQRDCEQQAELFDYIGEVQSSDPASDTVN